jgi:hypothetical protein
VLKEFLKIIKKIRGVKLILQIYSIRRIQKKNIKWSQENYILSQLKQSDSKLKQMFDTNQNSIELEHQIGRFLNMKQIAQKIISEKNSGAIVEFGTWQGLGIILLDQAFAQCSNESKNRTVGKYFIGVDTFTGLPDTSTVWQKGQFSDTSVEVVEKKLQKKLSKDVLFELIVGRFNEKHVKEKLFQHRTVALFHFDADLGSSTLDALKLAESYLSNKGLSVYFLFDDWGIHPDEVPDAFNSWYSDAKAKYNIKATKISSTRLTRNYRIDFL